jgi:hypothetical protein
MKGKRYLSCVPFWHYKKKIGVEASEISQIQCKSYSPHQTNISMVHQVQKPWAT